MGYARITRFPISAGLKMATVCKICGLARDPAAHRAEDATSVFVVDPGHPLAVEQREGISFHRATEYTYAPPDNAM